MRDGRVAHAPGRTGWGFRPRRHRARRVREQDDGRRPAGRGRGDRLVEDVDVGDGVLAVVDQQVYLLEGGARAAIVMLRHFEFRGPLISPMTTEAVFADEVRVFFRCGA